MRLIPVAVTHVPFSYIANSLMAPLMPSGDGTRFEGLCAIACGKKHATYLTSLMRASYAACAMVRRVTGKTTVLIPRYACPSFTHGIIAAGMKIRYCDLSPDTLCIEPVKCAPLIFDDVGALIVPNLFGLSSPMIELKAVCQEKGILLVEGADYTFGGTYESLPFGGFGDITILNFQEGKAIPIGGGMVLADQPILANPIPAGTSLIPALRMIAFKLLSHPRGYFLFRHALATLNIGFRQFSMEDTIRDTKDEFSFSFDSSKPLIGISCFQDAIGSRLLKAITGEMQCRINRYQALLNALRQCGRQITLFPIDSRISDPHMIRFPLLVPAEHRQTLIDKLFANGIEASPMYSELGLVVAPDEFPGCAAISQTLVTLPCNRFVTARDIATMTRIIEQTLPHEGDACT